MKIFKILTLLILCILLISCKVKKELPQKEMPKKESLVSTRTHEKEENNKQKVPDEKKLAPVIPQQDPSIDSSPPPFQPPLVSLPVYTPGTESSADKQKEIEKAQREQDLKSIMENIIMSHGGNISIEKYENYSWTSEGTMMSVPFKAKNYWISPDMFRIEMNNGLAYQWAMKRGFSMKGTIVLPIPRQFEEQLRIGNWVRYLLTILPLKDQTIILDIKKDHKFNKNKVIKFQVKGKEEKDKPVNIYFDSETYLLAGVEYEIPLYENYGLTSEVLTEYLTVTQIFSDYHSFKGVMLPVNIKTYFNKKLYTEETITDVFFASVDTTKFLIPKDIKEDAFFFAELPEVPVAYAEGKNSVINISEKNFMINEKENLLNWIKKRGYQLITQPFISSFIIESEDVSPLGSLIFVINEDLNTIKELNNNKTKSFKFEIMIPVFIKKFEEIREGNKGIKRLKSSTIACYIDSDNPEKFFKKIPSFEEWIHKNKMEIAGSFGVMHFGRYVFTGKDKDFKRDYDYKGVVQIFFPVIPAQAGIQ